MIDPRGPRLGETTDRIRVEEESARRYRAHLDEPELDLARLRVELAEILADATRRRQDEREDGVEVWRMRSRRLGLDMTARIERQGRVAVVVALTVRHYRQTGRGHRCPECGALMASLRLLDEHRAARHAGNAAPPEAAAYDRDVGRRGPVLNVRLRSDEERAAVDAAASGAGYTGTSTWAREVLLREAGLDVDEPIGALLARATRAGVPGPDAQLVVHLVVLVRWLCS